jgi:hypothetical protein
MVLLVATMLAHLRLNRGLQHRLSQPGEQTAPADQLDTVGASPVH